MATVPCPNCKGSGLVPDMKEIAAELARQRKEARVTLREVAALMGLSVGYISDLEHARKKWTPRKVNFYLAAIEAARQER